MHLCPDGWEVKLCKLNLLGDFGNVLDDLQNSFHIVAIGQVKHTVLHDNHNSAQARPIIILEYIEAKLSKVRYSGSYNQVTPEQLICLFLAAPFEVVNKPSVLGKFRIIQGFYFPHSKLLLSIKAQINASNFPCTWGFFHNFAKIVTAAPKDLLQQPVILTQPAAKSLYTKTTGSMWLYIGQAILCRCQSAI
ncbi:reverse transcriptase domain [Rhizoctonia solani]|uniref:Reverse transcriptase domain n=1 Tax=Rhizoctonia solani TaxID=456999 RepID=A0A8H8SYX1_9AGAM|nr:reverse transcriptase domain [Rhizoctonia solani]QRW22964.1 reverse transcriptase domain [Rhizoctonia solani]